jgi:hypothetical protein
VTVFKTAAFGQSAIPPGAESSGRAAMARGVSNVGPWLAVPIGVGIPFPGLQQMPSYQLCRHLPIRDLQAATDWRRLWFGSRLVAQLIEAGRLCLISPGPCRHWHLR